MKLLPVLVFESDQVQWSSDAPGSPIPAINTDLRVRAARIPHQLDPTLTIQKGDDLRDLILVERKAMLDHRTLLSSSSEVSECSNKNHLSPHGLC
jgi:hypothetical protein